MSIALVIATDKYVAVYIDCQHTNMRTGLPAKADLQKIEVLSDIMCITHCGSALMGEMYMKVVRELFQNGTIHDSSISTAVEVKQSYSSLISKFPDIESKCSSILIVCGRLDNGHPGFTVIKNTENKVTEKTIDGKIKPEIMIFPPADIESGICGKLVDDLTTEHLPKAASVPVLIETVFRQAVQEISKISKYVSSESLFYLYEV